MEWLGVATGRFDFVLLVRGPSLEHLRDVALHELQQLEGVRSAETVVLLDEVDQRDGPIWCVAVVKLIRATSFSRNGLSISGSAVRPSVTNHHEEDPHEVRMPDLQRRVRHRCEP